jgi:DNA-binding NarL/FixJ family response regulator
MRTGGPPCGVIIMLESSLLREALKGKIEDKLGLPVAGEAGEAETGMRLLKRVEPSLVIVDLSPAAGFDIELIRLFAKLRPMAPILVYSPCDELLYAERVLRAGARGFISQRSTGEEILTAIRRVLTGEIVVSKRVSSQIVQRSVGRSNPTAAHFLECLSDRELEVFTLLGNGVGSRKIAEQLNLSVHTIHTYREKIKQKLNCETGLDLIRLALVWVLDGGPQRLARPSRPLRSEARRSVPVEHWARRRIRIAATDN